MAKIQRAHWRDLQSMIAEFPPGGVLTPPTQHHRAPRTGRNLSHHWAVSDITRNSGIWLLYAKQKTDFASFIYTYIKL